MPVRTLGIFRGIAFATLAGMLATSCAEPSGSSQPKAVSRFEGTADPATGTLQIRLVQPPGTASLASAVLPGDTTPGRGLGTPNTVELATEWVSYTDLAGQTISTGSGAQPCGKPGSFCALVTMRSYFATQELHNLYAQIDTLAPAAHGGFEKSPDPGGLGLDAQYGLWAYPALLDSTRGAVGGAAPGANAASAIWYFDNADDSAFTFTGSIMGDVVPTTATGYEAVCGATPTALDTTANCGECGRSAPAGATCSYVGNGAASQGSARLVFGVTCGSAGQSACMTRAANVYDCVNLQTDAANCGWCGNSCGTGTCANGVCSTVKCPAGTTGQADGTCAVSSATGVAVGSDFACATATSSWLQQAWYGLATPTFNTNVLCWGNTPLGRAGGSTPPSALPWTYAQPYVDYLEDGYHLSALWTDHYALTCGASSCASLSTAFAALQGHPRIAYFMADQYWNYVYGVPTLATQLSLGVSRGVAIYPDYGTPRHRVLSWGSDNSHFQIGYGNGSYTTGYPNLALPAIDNPQLNVNYMTASDVAAGGNTSCAVLEAPYPSNDDGAGQVAGQVACWGQDDSGQASGTAGADVPTPAIVAGVSGATAISVGLRHTVAYDGVNLLFWGDDSSGQFGAAKAGAITTVAPGRAVSSLSAGADVTCYVSGGTVYCAGRNDRGQLGQGDTAAHAGFVAVTGVPGALSVNASATSGAGAGAVCAVASGAEVYCWGDNTGGQLGVGAAGGYSSTPVLVQMQPL